jgi:hypothetical protein
VIVMLRRAYTRGVVATTSKNRKDFFIETFALPTTAPSTAAAKDHGHRHQKKPPWRRFF